MKKICIIKASYLLMLQKCINSETKNCKIKDYALCLGNISKYFTVDNMQKNRIKGSCKI